MKLTLFGLSLLLPSIVLSLRGAVPGDSPLGPRKAIEVPMYQLGHGVRIPVAIAGFEPSEFRRDHCKSSFVPESPEGHDLAVNWNNMRAPRVTQKATGDFTVQVNIDGPFLPGEQNGKTQVSSYNASDLVIFADERNYVTLACAAFGGAGQRTGCMNFEIRLDGQNVKPGNLIAWPIMKNDLLYLRLEKKGQRRSTALIVKTALNGRISALLISPIDGRK